MVLFGCMVIGEVRVLRGVLVFFGWMGCLEWNTCLEMVVVL